MKKVLFVILIFSSLIVYSQNNCIDLDGIDDYLEANNLTSPLSSLSTYTFECWFKGDSISTTTGNQILWGINGQVGNPNTNVLMVAVHGNVLKVYDGNATGYTATTVLEQDVWYHIAMVKSSDDSFIVYLNGVQELTGYHTTIIPSGNTFSLGQEWDASPSDFYDGKIDEFRVWNDERTEAEIRQNMDRELNGSESGLIVYFDFNETSGTTADNVEGTSSYDATLTNMIGSEWATSSAMFGPKNALDLDGVDDYVNCGLVANPSALTSLTLECWVKADYIGSGYYNRIFSQDYIDADSPGLGWFNMNVDGTLYTYFSGALQGSLYAVNQGEWTHVALVWDGSNIYFFINGVQDPNVYTLSSLPDCTNNLYLGWQGHFNNTHFDGNIDEVRIWEIARTELEIRDNMVRSISGYESGLLAYYNFDNISGATLQDYSGNSNDGTLSNMDDSDWVSSSAFNTWLNTSSNAWSIASNWSLGSVPASDDNVGVIAYSAGAEAVVSNNPTVNHFIVSSIASPSLSSGITVNGNLVLESNVNLNGQIVNLGNEGYLVEDQGHFYGASGYLTITKSLNNISCENVAGLGAEITTTADMGSTTIIRYHSVITGVNSGDESISRWYDISPANNSGLNATLVFHYEDTELNGNTEVDLMLQKSEDSGVTWIAEGGVVNCSSNCISLSGISSFSRWTAIKSGGVLPVELMYFSAHCVDDNDVLLRWETALEHNNMRFEVQVSDDAKTFETVGVVSGAGTSLSNQYYEFRCKRISNASYYRLKQVDFDGGFSFSHVTNLKCDEKIDISLYPNPVKDVLIVDLGSTHDVIDVKVINEHGQSCLHERYENTGFVELSTSDWNIGVYLVEFHVDAELIQRKIVKL